MKGLIIIKKIDIIGVQMDMGASRRGVNMGPAAIRHADLHEKLDAQGITWRDSGDIIPMQAAKTVDNMKNFDAIVDANQRLYEATLKSLSEGYLPVVLGGDHSIAAGSIPAVQQHYGGIGLIWIDAHGDYNDNISSGSGNMHGMPFSAVTGHGPMAMMPYTQNFVDPAKCVQIGARDLDGPERKRLRDAGVTVFSIAEIDKLGIAQVVERAIEITSDGTKGIHVSFDIDAVTPDAAPGVGTPVHSGLTVREAFLAMEMLAESRLAVSMDMVEVNPILDERNKTGWLACELVLSLLGKAVY